jgi:general secretion pathway protein L
MKFWAPIANAFWRWIDDVAAFVASLPWPLASARAVKVMEVDDGEFVLQLPQELSNLAFESERIRFSDGEIAGTLPEHVAIALRRSRIELTLKPDRFLFRPLELPGKAVEFLDGIIRAQIARLSPWSAAEAAFGWSTPQQLVADRILVTVAVSARTLVKPYVEALARSGAQTITVFTCPLEPKADAAAIKILEEKIGGLFDIAKVRRILTLVLLVTGITTATAVAGSAIIGTMLAGKQRELEQQIADLRAASGASSKDASGSLAVARRKLEIRKQAMPPSVIIIETLSRILPDDTYVTELHVEDGKIQIAGVTRDAPSLIKLLEQSGLFAGATFFAPTTQSSAEPGQRFHIEALIRPTALARS